MYDTGMQQASAPVFGGNAQREPMMGAAFGALDQAASCLASNIEELEARLTPILGPAIPRGVGGNEKTTTRPALVDGVFQRADKVNLLASRLRDLVARLEI